MKRIITALVVCLPLAGCAGTTPNVPVLTRPTGNITIERQQFIDTWAATQVIWKALVRNAEIACEPPALDAERCAKLPAIIEQGRVLKLTIEAKLEHIEAEIDWDAVREILSLLAKFVL